MPRPNFHTVDGFVGIMNLELGSLPPRKLLALRREDEQSGGRLGLSGTQMANRRRKQVNSELSPRSVRRFWSWRHRRWGRRYQRQGLGWPFHCPQAPCTPAYPPSGEPGPFGSHRWPGLFFARTLSIQGHSCISTSAGGRALLMDGSGDHERGRRGPRHPGCPAQSGLETGWCSRSRPSPSQCHPHSAFLHDSFSNLGRGRGGSPGESLAGS